MKNFIYPILAVPAFFLLTAGVLYHNGSPGGKSGSPGDGASCTQCHAGTPVTGTTWITTNLPASGYTPGNTYMISITGSHSGAQRYGFEMTSENGSGQKKGAFAVTNNIQNQLVNAQASAITHTGSGITPSNDSITWTFNWTAPVTGTGNVTLYAAINAANGNGNTSGDIIYLTNQSFTEAIITASEDFHNESAIKVYPNPASDFLQVTIPSSLNANISLYSLDGKLMKSYIASNNQLFPVSEFERGIYLIRIETNSQISTTRLVLN
jgi:hypothetical protein